MRKLRLRKGEWVGGGHSGKIWIPREVTSSQAGPCRVNPTNQAPRLGDWLQRAPRLRLPTLLHPLHRTLFCPSASHVCLQPTTLSGLIISRTVGTLHSLPFSLNSCPGTGLFWLFPLCGYFPGSSEGTSSLSFPPPLSRPLSCPFSAAPGHKVIPEREGTQQRGGPGSFPSPALALMGQGSLVCTCPGLPAGGLRHCGQY